MSSAIAVTSSTGEDASRDRALALLGEVFSSRVRAALLAWAVPRLDTKFSLTELARDLGSPISSLQHECYKLERLGVLQGRREGASRRYHVQLDHALSRPLVNLVVATLGLQVVLADALGDRGRVDIALIAGPEPRSGSDRLILAIVGEVDLEGLDQAQRRVCLVIGIDDPDRVELAYFQRDDWLRHGGPDHALSLRLAGRPIQPITGAWPP